jgi:prepilin-type N-terminal cleavage/methylation domain-containing protein
MTRALRSWIGAPEIQGLPNVTSTTKATNGTKDATSPDRVRDRRAHRERRGSGFTLIELTVVLAVIVTLALVLTPSIVNFINDSRVARARSDVQTISAAVIQFYRDNGFFPQWTTANAGGPGLDASRVDLLVSGGNVPSVATPNTWTTGSSDLLDDQLISNAPGYTVRTATSAFGWNGPYLSSGIGPDAWNNRHMVNIGHIDTSQGTQAVGGGTKSAVWVISAGANGAIETVYTQPITTAVSGGDDIAIRIQ